MIKHRGSDLIEHPVLIRKGIFSTHEAGDALGWSHREVHSILFRLVKKGRLMRIKRGLFCIRPPGAVGSRQGYAQNWLLIARSLAGDKPYFISHYSAMQLHGMTGESVQTVFISMSEQHRPPDRLQIPTRFVTVPLKRFWGLEEKWITQEAKVWVSDRERTIIDILNRPDLAGGISEITRGLWMVRKEIDSSKLITYTKRFASYAAAKRLGFLMEKLHISTEKETQKLHHFTMDSSSYAFLDPTAEKTGHYFNRWHLRINQDFSMIEKNLMT